GCMRKSMELIFPHLPSLWKRVLFSPLSTLFSDYPKLKGPYMLGMSYMYGPKLPVIQLKK
ncbi:hypothetical protein ACFQ38_11745, partial [Sporosarcina contaminans]